MADGRHLGTIEKSPYLSNCLTDRLEVWLGELLKIQDGGGSKMVAAAILKNRKIAISQQWFDRSTRRLAW